MTDQPPKIGWFVIEADLDHDRDEPLYAHIRGPFESEEKAERERDQQKEAWEEALAEWDDGNPYDFKGWRVVRKYLYDFYWEKLDRQDEESYQIMADAADAVSASLLAEDGIGPLAGDGDAE